MDHPVTSKTKTHLNTSFWTMSFLFAFKINRFMFSLFDNLFFFRIYAEDLFLFANATHQDNKMAKANKKVHL